MDPLITENSDGPSNKHLLLSAIKVVSVILITCIHLTRNTFITSIVFSMISSSNKIGHPRFRVHKESAKLRALCALVLHVSRALLPLVPHVPPTLCALMSQVPRALRAVMPNVPCALRAPLPHVPHILHAPLLTTMICILY